ncbi:MAG TPA: saccharopine dehydrogenase C-terminal domain-containing protein [Anaerolineaceae bacterium]|nr:saccharopine dehydrogenase C-terminal domain-containing protein [Anaerolineaceae bacterium]
MAFRYAVFGSGRQGTAAAYDLARWGEAESVLLADQDLEAACVAAGRVNDLIGGEVCQPLQLDVTNAQDVEEALTGIDVLLSAVPYTYNLKLTEFAVRAGVSMCDLGGHVGIGREQHGYHSAALEAGISVIPNCGQVPGMGTTLIVHAMSMLDQAVDVIMWDGGLPQFPRPPFNYKMTFSIVGLSNEYAENAMFLRDWQVTEVETMTELEEVEFPEPIGKLEAFVTGGGIDTLPWTFAGKVRSLQNKTLRYPGHFAQMRACYDLGLWGLEPIQVDGVEVVPRRVFEALFAARVTFPDDPDMAIIRIKAAGEKDGRPAEALVEMIDYYDPRTGFTAMERCTGWSAAIVAGMMSRKQTPPGAGGVEIMVPPQPFIEELARRGIAIKEVVRFQ